jgi:hypothetical protein
MLPTFIVIGAMKAGTTSLYHYLSQHPEIGMSRRKELDFFKTNADFAKGLDWYAAQFPSGSRVLGESSPNYSKCHLFPGVAERLHSVLPRISLIYLVRHPVDRAVSHYVHRVSAGRESRPIEAVFEDLEQNPYVLTGAYMFQLRQFLKFYPAERMLIVDADDLLNDRVRTMSRIFKYLGVNERFYSKSFASVHNTSSSKRRAGVFDKVLHRMPGVSHVASHRLLLRVLGKATGAKTGRPVVSTAVSSRLLDYYSDDIDALERFVGQRFPAWHAPPATGTPSAVPQLQSSEG